MRLSIISALVSLFCTVALGYLTLPLLRRLKAGQPILKYVEAHKNKSGTPTMGGLFFIVPSCAVFLIFFGVKLKLAIFSLCVGLAFMVVGFLDDFIKVKFKQNEGLKPYQKILFQTSIAVVAGIFVWLNGLTEFYIPFTKKTVNLGLLSIPLVVVVFLAITNSVNLTDGLDGLAGSSTLFYLLFISILIYLQMNSVKYLYTSSFEFYGLINLSCCLIGAIAGFLLFNYSKASVFMGDTGSLALGGFVGSISIFSFNSLLIPILGLVYLLSSLSVIIQVVYFKMTRKRVFLMAPLHHHIQIKGHSEAKISYLYSLITCIMGICLIISYF